MVDALHTFSNKGGQAAMTYLVSCKPCLTVLYNQVYHLKYEAYDHAMIEELCRIIRAKGRHPENEKHSTWLDRVGRALDDIGCYDTQMSGWAHGNQFKPLPIDLMREMLESLRNDPASNTAITFKQIQLLLSHINIKVDKVSDLYVTTDNEGRSSVFSKLRGEWWMCIDKSSDKADSSTAITAPPVQLIALHEDKTSPTANIASVLGDTYHHFELARLFSNDLATLRDFVRDHYKFHVEWFEDTILAAGLPGNRTYSELQERMALYGVVQRLVCALVEGDDTGALARDIVYGPVVAPTANLPYRAGGILKEEEAEEKP